MAQAVPSWVVTGATVWAWLPQMPNPYYVSSTRWECEILAVKLSRSRRNPASVILSVPTEVYMGKSFKHYYPLFDAFVKHPTNPDSEALELKVYRGSTLVLEQLEVFPIAASTTAASQTPNTVSTASMKATTELTVSTASENNEAATIATSNQNDDLTFDTFCSQFLSAHDRSRSVVSTRDELHAPSGTICTQCHENILAGYYSEGYLVLVNE